MSMSWRNIQTFQGPVRLMVKLVQCRNEQCDDAKTFAPEQESEYAMPRWGIGWDVFCWIGQRRFSRHWSVPQIRHELADSYDIQLSDDAIEDHITSYWTWSAGSVLLRSRMSVTFTVSSNRSGRRHGPVATTGCATPPADNQLSENAGQRGTICI